MQIYEESSDMQNVLVSCDLTQVNGSSVNRDLMTTGCSYDINWAYRCNYVRNFGYEDNSPCFALTLNKIYGWLPPTSDGVQVCCGGATPNDDELLGTLCIYDAFVHDESGCGRRCGIFPHQFYPYLNQEFYLPPLVFMEVRGPRKNVLVRIQCQLTNLPSSSIIEVALLVD
ncbi:unnamed protein product [Dicrocoelium dendriticum]|nr:unnamed protein product [Dicrocoelium dendriticum]